MALAAFVARSRVVRFESLTEAVKQKFAEKAKLIPLNLKALEAGYKTGRLSSQIGRFLTGKDQIS